MLNTTYATGGMIVAPHHLAAEAGRDVLREGGNAIEATVAAAAAIAVVYPHMNALGGDGFWLLRDRGGEPAGIDASGAAAAAATPERYRREGLAAIPERGPLAANTVAGTVDGWRVALDVARAWGGRVPLGRLLEPAIAHARAGVPVTEGQSRLTAEKRPELDASPGFAGAFLADGAVPPAGTRFVQSRLADTLESLARTGLRDFYDGALARRVAADLARAGAPVSAADLAAHAAREVTPLALSHSLGRVYNLPPPTQGLASLIILGLYDRLPALRADGFDHVHRLVEATKQAFLVRDVVIADPARVPEPPADFLDAAALDARAARIDRERALPWPAPPAAGDTVWLGAVDARGRAASFIQSIYFEFGSGVVLEDTGILWQNRGSSFSLDPASLNRLAPGARPFHTLNPALAVLGDGRVMPYGTMGGEGQPQTQAAVFTRHVVHGHPLQAAVTAPRWLLGRTWGAQSTTLKIEPRFEAGVVEALAAAGHDVEIVAPFSDAMGHAGALVHHPGGLIEGAADPRSDGRAAGL